MFVLKKMGHVEQTNSKQTVGTVSDSGSGFLSFGVFRLTEQVSYHLYRRETDMRMSFDSLCGIVKNELGRTVGGEEAYVFINRHHTHLKLLVHNGSGFTLMYHRLDRGTFTIPVFDLDSRSVHLRIDALLQLPGTVRLR